MVQLRREGKNHAFPSSSPFSSFRALPKGEGREGEAFLYVWETVRFFSFLFFDASALFFPSSLPLHRRNRCAFSV